MADNQSNSSDETLEYLKREEVRTMAKDVKRFREQEAQKERERIAQLEIEKEIVIEKEMVGKIKEIALERMAEKERERQEQKGGIQAQQGEQLNEEVKRTEEQKPPAEQPTPATAPLEETPKEPRATPEETPEAERIEQEAEQQVRERLEQEAKTREPSAATTETAPQEPEFPERPGPSAKIIVRVFVTIFVIFIISSVLLTAYWQLQKRDVIPTISLPAIFSDISIPFFTNGPPTPPPPPPPPTPPPPPPVPLLSFISKLQPQNTLTIQFANKEELLSIFSLILDEEISQPGFTHLLLQEKGQEGSLNALEFFEMLEAQIPESLVAPLSRETGFFRYSFEKGSRWGFGLSVQDPSQVRGAFQGWEETLETDILSLAPLLGQKGGAYTTVFRSKSHEGIPIYFQTFSLNDTGIVYALIDEKYLIFSSSYETTQAVIDKLQESP